ncbi:class I adenylate-forming enzyme family protein [Streptomyces sp. NPDC008001]|uniref:class I adenylate-forming enzyme family protein n=1 Tax=Streptomyces sp. NPDC008001 TaxID=3364804 RepID=UPI0036F02F37
MTGTADDLSASRTLWELLDRRAELTPETPALIQADEPQPGGVRTTGQEGPQVREPGGTGPALPDRTVTFGELRARAERTAAGLYGLGVRPGSRVAWQLPTRIETVVLSFALARLGAVQTPLIPSYRDREAGHALRATEAGFFVVPGTWRGFDHALMAHRLALTLPAPPLVLTAYDSLPEGDPGDLPPPPADGTDIRWIYWTSGTTSAPKGALHTDRGLIAAGACLAAALRLTPEDVGSMAFPYAHVAGPDYTVMLLLRGFPALLVEHFALPGSLGAYRRNGVTVAGGSTAFYSMFLAQQRRQPGRRIVPTLRLMAGGGAPRPPELHHEVARELGCPLVHGYGMTEAPMITMGDPADTAERLAATEGRPAPGMEVRVTGPDGAPLPPGAEGAIRLRGEAVCQGYLDPALTAEAFDADGFLITGDLGRLTADGHLVITGRAKDVIIRKGENVSAQEVEQLLRSHPRIEDAAVIGLPDPVRGERVCAVVQQPPGAQPLTLGDIASHLTDAGLSVHKIPEQLELVGMLPRDKTLRKVLKGELRERYARPSQPPAR